MVYGILVQNGQLLAGQPTARVEVTEIKRPEHDDWNEYVRGLAQANAVPLAATHLVAEKSALKEGADPAGTADAAAGPGPERGTDAPSDVKQ